MPQTIIETGLEVWIQEYFRVKEDLSNFSMINNFKDASTELISKDRLRGYMFIGSLQLDRDYERRMIAKRKTYSENGKDILRSFTDFQEGIAGFSWRQD